MCRRIVAADGSAFVHKLCEVVHGFDDCGVVASASKVHGFLERFANTFGHPIESSADVDLYCVELAANFFIFLELITPLGPHLLHEAFIGGVDFANLRRIKVYQFLCLILAEPKFSEDGVADSRVAASRVCPSGIEKSA